MALMQRKEEVSKKYIAVKMVNGGGAPLEVGKVYDVPKEISHKDANYLVGMGAFIADNADNREYAKEIKKSFDNHAKALKGGVLTPVRAAKTTPSPAAPAPAED